MSNLRKWAKREIDLASKENDPVKDEELNHSLERAFFAFCDVITQIENSKNQNDTRDFFIKLFNGNNLTPIEDNEDDWTIVEGFDLAAGNENPGWTVYQCKRRTTLFKRVTYDRKTGEVNNVKFSDTDRAVCIDINTNKAYIGDIGYALYDEMFPIKIPYQPGDKVKIFTEEFKAYEDCESDFDTFGVLYFRFPNGKMIEVKRFFKEDPKTHQIIEIDRQEYFKRKVRSEKRK